MAGIGESERLLIGIEDSVNHGYVPPGREVVLKHAIEPAQHFRWRIRHACQRTQDSTGGGHQECRGHAFAGYIGQHDAPAISTQIDVVVPVATHFACLNTYRFQGKSRKIGRCLGQQRFLDETRLFGFTFHALALVAFCLESTCILDRQRNVSTERRLSAGTASASWCTALKPPITLAPIFSGMSNSVLVSGSQGM